jgi:ankyrin repeat protein
MSLKCRLGFHKVTARGVNAKNSKDKTPLILASIYGHWKLVQSLLDKGADVNTEDKCGRTALSYASKMYLITSNKG